MSRQNTPTPPLSLDPQVDENRVRRALGLHGNTPHTHRSDGHRSDGHRSDSQRSDGQRQRHRFVSDGAVPVVMLNRADTEASGLKERLAAAETALEHERAAHAATKRAWQDALAEKQLLQTRLGHAELSHNEAIAAERQARRAAEEALAAVRTAAAETALDAAPAVSQAAPKRRGRKPSAEPKPARPAREPKPVRWWTPSYRAKRS